MAIDKIFNDANVDGIADNIFGAVNNSVSEVKAMQQRKAAENVQLVVEAFKKIETNITEKFDNVTDVIEKRVLTIKDGRDGSSGSDGRNGRDGKPGRDGVNGKQGTPGTPGKDGTDGVDGVSVTDASIDFDGSLVISLSSGQQINVGEVVPPELERQLVELRQGGGSAGSSGDVMGPTASTDNAIARFDGTTGKLVQNSVVTIADTTGNMAGVGTLGVGAITTTGALVGTATQSAFNTVSTTLNIGGAATAVNIGAATGTLTVANTTLAAKAITASTTLGVTGVSTLTAGAVIEGMTVGLGSGSVATNTAVGFRALLVNINGTFNSASGYEALRYNTTGYSNTATGNAALHENISGYGNTASGSSALYYNTLGDSNVATGASSLLYNTSGSSNTVSGAAAMQSNATGSRNTAIGAQALITYTPPVVTAGAFVIATAYTIVTVGTTNFVAIGASANTVGVVFTATGAGSGTGTASTNVDATNTAIGYGAGSAITTGTKNTIIGAYTGNQGGLDIRAASNYIVLSDGDGNPRAYWNGANATFGGSLTLATSVVGGATMAVFNTVSTTVNAFGAATTLNVGAATGTLTVANTTLAAKAITASTTLGVTGVSTLTAGAVVQGLTVGLGAGAVATNTAVGASALAANTSGTSTSAFGANALASNTSGTQNTGLGYYALQGNNTGSANTGVGYGAGYQTTTGSNNTSVGQYALQSNSTASNNTAIGYQALYANTGAENVAIGAGAISVGVGGSASIAIGIDAFRSNTSFKGIAIGYQAGYINSGSNNIFIGNQAGYTTTSGISNAYIGVNGFGGVGFSCGYYMTTGSYNVILGSFNGNQDALDIRTSSKYVVVSNGEGTRVVTGADGKSLALAVAVPQTGTGITFPATQSASTDANTLDDYEEGTFTPTLTGSSGSASYNSRDGIYVKVGKVVTINFWVYGSSVSTLSGNLTMNLPYPSSSTASFSGYRPAPSIVPNNLTVTGSISGYVPSNSSTLTIYIVNNGSVSSLNASNIPSSAFEIGGTLSYITD